MTGRIAEQLEQVEADLVELAEQVEAGEVDEETAARLRADYLAEATELRRQLEEAGGADAVPGDEAEVRGRSPWRVAAGAAVLIVSTAFVVGLAFRTAERGDANVVDGVVADVVSGRGVDLSQVTNEQMEEVVAANPDVVPMRLALARRYFEEGDFDRAFDHYMAVLERQQEPEALAAVGWMSYLSGRPDLAISFLERAVALAPDYPQAWWWLANTRMYGLDDPTGAVEPLRRVLEYEDLPPEVRAEAERMLEEAGA